MKCLSISVLLTIVVFSTSTFATEKGGTATGKTARDGVASGIDWFDGTVDEAFAAAGKSAKPVFLYWGAEWCPPCHAINNTVFKSPSFIERSKLFVPVYLDGDTAHAQAAGERFGVRGYPTMIVFAADGEELTRIPGGIDVQAYANVLDRTLQDTLPVSEIVERVTSGDHGLSATECSQLAWYSWGQDLEFLENQDSADAFRRMFEACPSNLQSERSILYFNWLDARLAEIDDENEILDDDSNPVTLSDDERTEALRMLNRVLGNEQLVLDNLFSVLFAGATYTAAVSKPGSAERAQLTRRFHEAYGDILADENVYKRERLYTLAGKIEFERIDDADASLSDSLRQEIRDVVAWADESTPDPYERQPIINAAANVLEDAGMDDDARTLLLKELKISKQAYYFMPTLGDIEKRAGNYDAALEWLEKGYDTSTGPATRFQWGLYYLEGLLEMTPEDTDGIEAMTLALVEEVQAGGGFYNRPKMQLERLSRQLQAWSEDQGTANSLDRLRASIATVCARESAGESRSACESFLDAA